MTQVKIGVELDFSETGSLDEQLEELMAKLESLKSEGGAIEIGFNEKQINNFISSVEEMKGVVDKLSQNLEESVKVEVEVDEESFKSLKTSMEDLIKDSTINSLKTSSSDLKEASVALDSAVSNLKKSGFGNTLQEATDSLNKAAKKKTAEDADPNKVTKADLEFDFGKLEETLNTAFSNGADQMKKAIMAALKGVKIDDNEFRNAAKSAKIRQKNEKEDTDRQRKKAFGQREQLSQFISKQVEPDQFSPESEARLLEQVLKDLKPVLDGYQKSTNKIFSNAAKFRKEIQGAVSSFANVGPLTAVIESAQASTREIRITQREFAVLSSQIQKANKKKLDIAIEEGNLKRVERYLKIAEQTDDRLSDLAVTLETYRRRNEQLVTTLQSVQRQQRKSKNVYTDITGLQQEYNKAVKDGSITNAALLDRLSTEFRRTTQNLTISIKNITTNLGQFREELTLAEKDIKSLGASLKSNLEKQAPLAKAIENLKAQGVDAKVVEQEQAKLNVLKAQEEEYKKLLKDAQMYKKSMETVQALLEAQKEDESKRVNSAQGITREIAKRLRIEQESSKIQERIQKQVERRNDTTKTSIALLRQLSSSEASGNVSTGDEREQLIRSQVKVYKDIVKQYQAASLEAQQLNIQKEKTIALIKKEKEEGSGRFRGLDTGFKDELAKNLIEDAAKTAEKEINKTKNSLQTLSKAIDENRENAQDSIVVLKRLDEVRRVAEKLTQRQLKLNELVAEYNQLQGFIKSGVLERTTKNLKLTADLTKTIREEQKALNKEVLNYERLQNQTKGFSQAASISERDLASARSVAPSTPVIDTNIEAQARLLDQAFKSINKSSESLGATKIQMELLQMELKEGGATASLAAKDILALGSSSETSAREIARAVAQVEALQKSGLKLSMTEKDLIKNAKMVQKSFSQVSASVKNNENAYKRLAKSIRTLNKIFKEASEEQAEMIRSNLKYINSMGVILSVVLAVRMAFSRLIEESRAIARTMTVLQSETKSFGIIMTETTQSVRDAAIKFGESVENTAEVVKQFGSAGFSAEEALAALDSTMKLIVATQADAESSARAVAGIYRVFGDELRDVSDRGAAFKTINDVLISVYRNHQVELDELVQGFKFSGAAASAAGFSFKETAAFLSVLNDNMIKSGAAGRGLQVLFAQTASKSDQIAKALNVRIDPSKTLPAQFMMLLEEVNKSLSSGGISVAELEKRFKVFGLRGARSFITLSKNVDDVNKALKQLDNSSGQTDEVVGIIGESLAKQFERGKQAITDVLRTLVEGFGPFIKLVVDAAVAVREFFQEYKTIAQIVAGVTALATAVVYLTVQIGALILLAKGASMVFSEMRANSLKLLGPLNDLRKSLDAKIYKTLIGSFKKLSAGFGLLKKSAGGASSAMGAVASGSKTAIAGLGSVATSAKAAGIAVKTAFAGTVMEGGLKAMSASLAAVSGQLGKLKSLSNVSGIFSNLASSAKAAGSALKGAFASKAITGGLFSLSGILARVDLQMARLKAYAVLSSMFSKIAASAKILGASLKSAIAARSLSAGFVGISTALAVVKAKMLSLRMATKKLSKSMLVLKATTKSALSGGVGSKGISSLTNSLSGLSMKLKGLKGTGSIAKRGLSSLSGVATKAAGAIAGSIGTITVGAIAGAVALSQFKKSTEGFAESLEENDKKIAEVSKRLKELSEFSESLNKLQKRADSDLISEESLGAEAFKLLASTSDELKSVTSSLTASQTELGESFSEVNRQLQEGIRLETELYEARKTSLQLQSQALAASLAVDAASTVGFLDSVGNTIENKLRIFKAVGISEALTSGFQGFDSLFGLELPFVEANSQVAELREQLDLLSKSQDEILNKDLSRLDQDPEALRKARAEQEAQLDSIRNARGDIDKELEEIAKKFAKAVREGKSLDVLSIQAKLSAEDKAELKKRIERINADFDKIKFDDLLSDSTNQRLDLTYRRFKEITDLLSEPLDPKFFDKLTLGFEVAKSDLEEIDLSVKSLRKNVSEQIKEIGVSGGGKEGFNAARFTKDVTEDITIPLKLEADGVGIDQFKDSVASVVKTLSGELKSRDRGPLSLIKVASKKAGEDTKKALKEIETAFANKQVGAAFELKPPQIDTIVKGLTEGLQDEQGNIEISQALLQLLTFDLAAVSSETEKVTQTILDGIQSGLSSQAIAEAVENFEGIGTQIDKSIKRQFERNSVQARRFEARNLRQDRQVNFGAEDVLGFDELRTRLESQIKSVAALRTDLAIARQELGAEAAESNQQELVAASQEAEKLTAFYKQQRESLEQERDIRRQLRIDFRKNKDALREQLFIEKEILKFSESEFSLAKRQATIQAQKLKDTEEVFRLERSLYSEGSRDIEAQIAGLRELLSQRIALLELQEKVNVSVLKESSLRLKTLSEIEQILSKTKSVTYYARRTEFITSQIAEINREWNRVQGEGLEIQAKRTELSSRLIGLLKEGVSLQEELKKKSKEVEQIQDRQLKILERLVKSYGAIANSAVASQGALFKAFSDTSPVTAASKLAKIFGVSIEDAIVQSDFYMKKFLDGIRQGTIAASELGDSFGLISSNLAEAIKAEKEYLDQAKEIAEAKLEISKIRISSAIAKGDFKEARQELDKFDQVSQKLAALDKNKRGLIERSKSVLDVEKELARAEQLNNKEIKLKIVFNEKVVEAFLQRVRSIKETLELVTGEVDLDKTINTITNSDKKAEQLYGQNTEAISELTSENAKLNMSIRSLDARLALVGKTIGDELRKGAISEDVAEALDRISEDKGSKDVQTLVDTFKQAGSEIVNAIQAGSKILTRTAENDKKKKDLLVSSSASLMADPMTAEQGKELGKTIALEAIKKLGRTELIESVTKLETKTTTEAKRKQRNDDLIEIFKDIKSGQDKRQKLEREFTKQLNSTIAGKFALSVVNQIGPALGSVAEDFLKAFDFSFASQNAEFLRQYLEQLKEIRVEYLKSVEDAETALKRNQNSYYDYLNQLQDAEQARIDAAIEAEEQYRQQLVKTREVVRDNLKNFVESFISAASSGAKQLISLGDSLFGGAGIAQATAQLFGVGSSGPIDQKKQFSDAFQSAAGDYLSSISSESDRASMSQDISSLRAEMTTYLARFADSSDSLDQSIYEMVQALKGKAGSEVLQQVSENNSFSSTGENLLQFSKNLFEAMMDIPKGIFASVAQLLKGDFSGALEAIFGRFNQVADPLRNIFQSFSEVDFGTWSGFLDGISMVFANVYELAQAISQEFTGLLLQGIVTFASQIASLSMGDNSKDALRFVTRFIEELPEAATEFVDNFVENAGRVAEAVAKAAPKIVETIVEELPRLLDGFVNALEVMIPKVVSSISQALPAIVQKLVPQLFKLIRLLIAQLPSILSAVIESIPILISEFIKEIPSLVVEIVKAVLKLIPQSIGGFFSGIASGIGSIFGFNSGGLVGGSGSRDTIPAMLTPGEFVLPKGVTAEIGRPTLERLRRGDYRDLQGRGYNSGGLVVTSGNSSSNMTPILSGSNSKSSVDARSENYISVNVNMSGNESGADVDKLVDTMVSKLDARLSQLAQDRNSKLASTLKDM